jgi:hypothetical protein
MSASAAAVDRRAPAGLRKLRAVVRRTTARRRLLQRVMPAACASSRFANIPTAGTFPEAVTNETVACEGIE